MSAVNLPLPKPQRQSLYLQHLHLTQFQPYQKAQLYQLALIGIRGPNVMILASAIKMMILKEAYATEIFKMRIAYNVVCQEMLCVKMKKSVICCYKS